MVLFPIDRENLTCGKVPLGKGPTFNLALVPIGHGAPADVDFFLATARLTLLASK